MEIANLNGKRRRDRFVYEDAYRARGDATLLGTRDGLNPVLGLVVEPARDRLKLYASASAKTRFPALSVVLTWQGADQVRAQNLWRRWMLAHNTPYPGGQPPAPIFCFCDGAFFPGLKLHRRR